MACQICACAVVTVYYYSLNNFAGDVIHEPAACSLYIRPYRGNKLIVLCNDIYMLIQLVSHAVGDECL